MLLIIASEKTGLQLGWTVASEPEMRRAESTTEGRPPFDIVIIYSLSQHHNPQQSGVSSAPLKCISASVSSSAQNDWVTFMRLTRGCHRCLGQAKSNAQQSNKSTCNKWQGKFEYDTLDLSTVTDNFIIWCRAIVKVLVEVLQIC